MGTMSLIVRTLSGLVLVSGKQVTAKLIVALSSALIVPETPPDGWVFQPTIRNASSSWCLMS